MPTTVDHEVTVRLILEGPREQRRVTVLLRPILSIPHWIYAAVLGFVVSVAIVVTWFAALVLGRVPNGLHDFVTRVLQYYTRVYGYSLFLLTDRYPPFEIGQADHPVEADVEPPDRLNRGAVLFRFVLLIPTGVVVQLLGSGVLPVLVVTWLILLVTGRMPTSLFEALASILRYHVRFYAFAGMLTSEYPRGLYGDGDSTDPDMATPAADPLGIAPIAPPRTARLVLSRAARRIVVLTLVLGVIVGIGIQVLPIVANLNSDDIEELDSSHEQLEAALDRFAVDAQGCAVTADASCIRRANRDLRVSLSDFQRQLRSMDLPASARDEARQVDDDLDEMIGLLATLGSEENPDEYVELAQRLQDAGTAFDRHYDDLYEAVLFG